MNRSGMLLFLVGVFLALSIAGCAIPGVQGTQIGKTLETIPVKVYFGAKDAEHVEAELHNVKKDAELMKRTMELLIAGPRSANLWPVLPAATQVKSVIVKDQTAYVDFSEALVKQRWGGSSREILAVAAIVNTLTEFPEVERVQILLEGGKMTTLFGHMDLSEPLSRSPAMIRNQE